MKCWNEINTSLSNDERMSNYLFIILKLKTRQTVQNAHLCKLLVTCLEFLPSHYPRLTGVSEPDSKEVSPEFNPTTPQHQLTDWQTPTTIWKIDRHHHRHPPPTDRLTDTHHRHPQQHPPPLVLCRPQYRDCFGTTWGQILFLSLHCVSSQKCRSAEKKLCNKSSERSHPLIGAASSFCISLSLRFGV